MEEKKLIQFQNIVKDFDGTLVLKGINLDIYENEFVTLLGPSGCGKQHFCEFSGISESKRGACDFRRGGYHGCASL